jgi:hypothetical protein
MTFEQGVLAMKVIDHLWFSSIFFSLGFETIGIVIGEDEITGERKAYIGLGTGHSEEEDIKAVTQLGAKLTPQAAAHIAKLLNETKSVTNQAGDPNVDQ